MPPGRDNAARLLMSCIVFVRRCYTLLGKKGGWLNYVCYASGPVMGCDAYIADRRVLANSSLLGSSGVDTLGK